MNLNDIMNELGATTNQYAYIYMRKSISMSDLTGYQKRYEMYKKSFTVSPELVEAIERLFDKVDQGSILVGGE